VTARYRIAGFCDVKDKRHGADDLVYFAEKHCFIADAVPPAAELMKYAKRKRNGGRPYYPSGKRGSDPTICSPVYFAVAEAAA
jgi:hypothetical protein